MNFFVEPERKLPVTQCDVLVAGGGTAGVFAAIAAARQGARTILVENKGYVGGIAVEGGTSLHSFFNLWKPFGVEKKQLVKGIPDEFINRLRNMGGTPGHVDQLKYSEYDSACTTVDTEIYKFVALQMLREAGVAVLLNTAVVQAHRLGSSLAYAIVESRNGREAISAKMFIDATGYGDLSARAEVSYKLLNDHPVANSVGVGGVDIERYTEYLNERDCLMEYALGTRDGKADQFVRFTGAWKRLSPGFAEKADALGMSSTLSSTHDNYVMFLKFNHKMDKNPTDRDCASDTEFELRRAQLEGIQLLRQELPGFENAFIARSAPSFTIRRARCVECEYDISNDEIVNGVHFSDDIYSYGFHDCAPRIQIKNGASFGLPYRAIQAKGIKNLLVIGMLITSERDAHMSTRNTVSCMAMGQSAGTAAALCALSGQEDIRSLPYDTLKKALLEHQVILEN